MAQYHEPLILIEAPLPGHLYTFPIDSSISLLSKWTEVTVNKQILSNYVEEAQMSSMVPIELCRNRILAN